MALRTRYNPPMWRRAMHALTLMSALVCAGSLLLVGRSFFKGDQLWSPLGQKSSGWVQTSDGYLFVVYIPQNTGEGFQYLPVEPDGLRALGESWGNYRGVPWVIAWDDGAWSWGQRLVILPLWLVPVLTAIPLVRWWWRARRRRGARGFAVAPSAA